MKQWWFMQVLFFGVSVFFALFGVDLFLASYRLPDPFSFIMTFFAGSFVILVSTALAISFVITMIRMYKKEHNISGR